VGIRVNWVRYLKLSEGNDLASGTCFFGDYVAVVGSADNWPSVVLLDRDTGEVVKTWRGEFLGYFSDCLSVGDTLYAVGVNEEKGYIYAFDKNLRVIKGVSTIITGYPHCSISYDGEYLYTLGRIDEDDSEASCIEKRTLNLKLIRHKELDRSTRIKINNIGVNPATGELWAIGVYYTEPSSIDELLKSIEEVKKGVEKLENLLGSTEITEIWALDFDNPCCLLPLLVIYDGELREVKRVEYPKDRKNYLGILYDICFDYMGNAYVAGSRGIAKLDRHSNLVAVNILGSVRKIACGDLIYAFGNVRMGHYYRHVLYVLDGRLNAIEEQFLSKSVDTNSFFSLGGKASFDGYSVYAAGFDYFLGKENGRWVIYSIATGKDRTVPYDS